MSDQTVDQGTIDEIREQVQAGMVATVHQHPITYAGWTGAGYTIIDPETGAGGFKISGGSDGGESVFSVLKGFLAFLGVSQSTLSVLDGLASGPFLMG